MEQIRVGGYDIDLIRKDIKNLHLGVYPPTGRVRIAVPLNVDDESVRLFAISKMAWIKKNQRNFQEQPRISIREFVSGESHYFNGRRYRLNVITHDAPPKVVLRHQYIDLFVREGTDESQRRQVMDKWYRSYLKQEAEPVFQKWKDKLQLSDVTFSIKRMRTKWGSCNIEDRRVWLNLELAKQKLEALEFVIVHELMHFFERHHNERFFSLMTSNFPEWQRIKAELKELPLTSAE